MVVHNCIPIGWQNTGGRPYLHSYWLAEYWWLSIFAFLLAGRILVVVHICILLAGGILVVVHICIPIGWRNTIAVHICIPIGWQNTGGSPD